MWLLAWIELILLWLAWFYPYVFRAPHGQKRQAITVLGATRIGLLLQSIAIFLAWNIRVPVSSPPGVSQLAGALILGAASVAFFWRAIVHLGKQFRIHAGLYVDHELIRTGPYAIVRHPIYASLFGMLLCTILLLTRWQWAIVSIVLYIIGTEIRVQTEDRLLAGRFGAQFDDYRGKVSAYIPFVR